MNIFDVIPDLKIGHIVEVSGSSLRVELAVDVNELTRTYQGRVYPIGQIGSVVKVHFGRRLVFGFVSLLRMRSEEQAELIKPVPPDADQRIMDIELFSEGSWNSVESRLHFSRGVTTYPLPRQGVYLLTKEELVELYKSAEGMRSSDGVDPLVAFSSYIGADSAPCRANIDRMFGMHCAVLGSTGSGKSGAVAAVIHSILDHKSSNSARCHPRIVIIDPHGEYSHAFSDRAICYRAYDPIGTDETVGEPISLPYWLMSGEEFRSLLIGKTEFEATSQNNIVYKALAHARMAAAKLVKKAPAQYVVMSGVSSPDDPQPLEGVSMDDILSFDRDKPRPFCLDEFYNHINFLQAAKPTKAERVSETDFGKFKAVIDKLSTLRRDPRIRFLMAPWSEDSPNLSQVLQQFVGEMDDPEKDLRIINISGLPNEVAGPLAALVARLLFQYKLYQTKSERSRDPVALVCEEAHRYVPDKGDAEYSAAQGAIRRIAREGRKYGIGLMLVSQRPADIESTVIAQCGTWLVLRLTNAADQQHVSRFLPDGLSGMTRALPNLAQQEAIFVGEGSALPARVRINDLGKEKLPKSESAKYAEGWMSERLNKEEIDAIAERMSS